MDETETMQDEIEEELLVEEISIDGMCGVYWAVIRLADAYRLDPHVAIRAEPFGALAYHYGNRRLVFLKSADIVKVVETIDQFDSLESALSENDVETERWPSLMAALESLEKASVIHAR